MILTTVTHDGQSTRSSSNMENIVRKNNKMFKFIALTIASWGGSSQLPAAETQFNQALAASNAGNSAQLQQYQTDMQNDVLGYYPEYWLLNQNLAFQPANKIISFAQRYPHSAMAEKLSADYVEEKVKQADFDTALPVLRYVSNADQAERCAIAQVRAKTGDELVFAEFKDVWLTTETQPDSCNGLGRMMLSSQLWQQSDRLQRLWAQLRAGQSGQAISTAQTIGINLSMAQLNQIQANPQNYLWNAAKTSHEDQAYLIFALGRIASTDLDAALGSLAKAGEGVPDIVNKALNRTVAYIGGTTVMKNNFNRAVLNAFDASYGLPFSPEDAEIYARQAIRFGAWESVIRAVQSMGISQQQEDRWQYWLARGLEQRSDRDAKASAQQIYQRLAQGQEYHHLLAKERLGQKPKMSNYQPTNSDIQRLSQDINFNRAFTLKEIAAPESYVNREWNWAVRQAYLKQDDALLLAAAKRANDMAWYDRAIYAADRTVQQHNDSYRFSMPYRNAVVNYSQSAGVDPAWVYGLMRQESRFNANARSGVGASGLMQVMPETAKEIARDLGDSYSASGFTNPDTNIRYGSHYVGKIQRQLSGSVVLATAGYNAGPTRARRWQPEGLEVAADQYTESIPLSETRDYVKNVMTNATHYAMLLGQPNASMQQRMQPIPARN